MEAKHDGFMGVPPQKWRSEQLGSDCVTQKTAKLYITCHLTPVHAQQNNATRKSYPYPFEHSIWSFRDSIQFGCGNSCQGLSPLQFPHNLLQLQYIYFLRPGGRAFCLRETQNDWGDDMGNTRRCGIKNCKERGEWAELCFMARAASRGFRVSRRMETQQVTTWVSSTMADSGGYR